MKSTLMAMVNLRKQSSFSTLQHCIDPFPNTMPPCSCGMDAMSAPVTWTIKALLTWTTQYLAEKKIESPRLEAELLLAHALKCKRIDLMVRFHEEPSAEEKTAYR